MYWSLFWGPLFLATHISKHSPNHISSLPQVYIPLYQASSSLRIPSGPCIAQSLFVERTFSVVNKSKEVPMSFSGLFEVYNIMANVAMILVILEAKRVDLCKAFLGFRTIYERLLLRWCPRGSSAPLAARAPRYLWLFNPN